MGDLLRLPLRVFRRAATPPAVPQSPAQGSPQPEPATAPYSAEVVNLEDRRIPKVPLPWWPPMPPYVGAFILGAALTTSTAAHVAANLSLLPGRIAAAAFTTWSA